MKFIKSYSQHVFESNQESVKETNKKTFTAFYNETNSRLKKEILEVPDYYESEVGYEKILDYVEVEGGMRMDMSVNPVARRNAELMKMFGKEEEEHQKKQRMLETENWEKIKNQLISFFIRRLGYNMPTEELLETEQDCMDYLMMYIEKFLHGYLIPMAETKHIKKED